MINRLFSTRLIIVHESFGATDAFFVPQLRPEFMHNLFESQNCFFLTAISVAIDVCSPVRTLFINTYRVFHMILKN